MKVISNRDTALYEIDKLLKKNGYPTNNTMVEGVADIVNKIADYHEEGVKLYPEVLILHDDYFLKPLQARTEMVYQGEIKENEFSKAMKLCAPLATGNWNIYIVLPDDKHISYGLVSVERKETSLDLVTQAIEMGGDDGIIYIRNVGSKNVELRTKQESCIISLTLDGDVDFQDSNLQKLVEAMLKDLAHDEVLHNFIVKTIKDALNAGHGNLIAVCKRENFELCLTKMTGGAKLTPAIDIPELLNEDKMIQSSETSVAIKSNMTLVKSVINHDGITFFSTRGELLGYHYIVDNSKVGDGNAVGGSRTKAFEALKTIGEIEGRFFKSQDGITKYC